MAAIIAQMAANNRERKKRAEMRESGELVTQSNKSSVFLTEFTDRFDPTLHNPYVRNQLSKEQREQEEEEERSESMTSFNITVVTLILGDL